MAGPSEKDGGDLVQGLSDTAQTIGASLQTMQRALVGNMEQAAQMMASMNAMMEELVRRSVRVGVFARQAADAAAPGCRTRLTVTVKNDAPVPLRGARVRLWFSLRRQPPCPVRAQAAACGGGMALAGRSAELAVGPLGGEPLLQTAQPLDLASGAAAEAEAELALDAPEQLYGRIAMEFPSPGTGQPLRVEHGFGIRLLQLARCSFERGGLLSPEAAALEPVADAPHVSVGLGRARELFAVPPADGIGPGCVLVVHAHGSLLGLRVCSVSAAGAPAAAAAADCEWVAAAASSPDLLALVPRLAEELAAGPQ
ncbi:hypothetical protein H4R18_003922 [Coemansia javaensis]|uniref:Uncharacterized protein n=1 Tax=Coemansia javaensis TaxID=2761396 RepID=A0A9W8HAW6_9FUNG|nr:hypothetical protein H4R18_003922 [Coemansia javaensis]